MTGVSNPPTSNHSSYIYNMKWQRIGKDVFDLSYRWDCLCFESTREANAQPSKTETDIEYNIQFENNHHGA